MCKMMRNIYEVKRRKVNCVFEKKNANLNPSFINKTYFAPLENF